ncbi:MAG TPA: TetR/AcrR family transcriptional regulator [Polyangia bacterium]|nr:TetR/AcrR family transcriptional regulator [Polyangia bacterium]
MARTPGDISIRVVRAARARFLAEGVDGASLRAIARDARTNIGMIYYYYPTKDDLLLAVVEEVYVALLRDLEAQLAPARPVLERLQALYQRVAGANRDEREVMRLVLREALTSPARLNRLIRRFQRGHLPLLFRMVADGVEAGLFRGDVPEALLLAGLIALGGPGQVILSVFDTHVAPGRAPAGSGRPAALVDLFLTGAGGSSWRRPHKPAQSRSGSPRARASTSAREVVPAPRSSRWKPPRS